MSGGPHQLTPTGHRGGPTTGVRSVGILDTPAQDDTPEIWTEAKLDAHDAPVVAALPAAASWTFPSVPTGLGTETARIASLLEHRGATSTRAD